MEPELKRAPALISSAPSTPAWANRFTPDALFRFGLLILIALYLRSLTFDFVYDDLFIPLNPWIQSWHGVLDSFKSDIWGFNPQNATSYYRPLPAALGVVISRLLAPTPGWFHFTSLLIETLLCAVCYWCGKLLFDDDWLAALTTVFFILHPTKVETVAWIGSSECDGQAAVYFFGVLGCYLSWWKSRKPAWAIASVVLFALAMFTKETMGLLPVLLLIHYLLRFKDRDNHPGVIGLFAGYAVVVLGYLSARHAVLKPVPAESISIQVKFGPINFWTAPSAFWWYLQHFLLPIRLGILYDFHTVSHPNFREFLLPLAGVLCFAAILLALWWRRRSWLLPFLCAWFVLLIAAPVALAPGVTVHDRYLQLPSYALCAGVAWILLDVIRERTRWRSVAIGAATALVILASAATWHESGFWDNDVRLWERAVQVAPHSINARVELARLYGSARYNDAIKVLDDGIRVVPDSPGLWRIRGLMMFDAGDYEAARTSLLKSLEVSERFHNQAGSEPPDVKYGRATVAFFLGQIEMVEGNPQSADAWLRMATSIQPNNLDYARTMVKNLRLQGRNAEAEQYQRIVDELVARSKLK